MTMCIGRIMGRPGDWYAELDFENGEANVMERGSGKPLYPMPVATLPLGEWVPETEDHDAALCPDCPQAQRLMKVVFAPEAWALLASIRKELKQRVNISNPHKHWSGDSDEALIDQIDRTLDCLKVPGRDEPDNTDDLDARTGMTEDERGNIG